MLVVSESLRAKASNTADPRRNRPGVADGAALSQARTYDPLDTFQLS
jgi:hypothetical protein